MYIDTHCHIYLDEFDNDRGEMIARAENHGVNQFYMPAIDSSIHESMLTAEEEFKGKARAMMGLHPCSVNNKVEEELALVESWFEKRAFIAVGETGLDYYWDTSFVDLQKMAMRRQTDLALKYNRPIVIHSRNSIDDCIDIVQEKQNGKLKGVFHCFSGTLEQAQKIIDLGFYLGIGGVLTFKNSGLDKVVQELTLDKLVLETDAPYLAPVPFRGKRNESAYVPIVAEKLATLIGISLEEVAAMTTANAKKLFQ
jgi:TatD DNase family protein